MDRQRQNKCLEKVQEKVIGMVSGLTARTYEGKLKELGLVTPEERRRPLNMQQTPTIFQGSEKVKKETCLVWPVKDKGGQDKHRTHGTLGGGQCA
jgi:hypothetical protein